MPKFTTKTASRRKPTARQNRRGLPHPRRSSYLEPSAETIASLNEDTSKLPTFKTAEDFFKALEQDDPQ